MSLATGSPLRKSAMMIERVSQFFDRAARWFIAVAAVCLAVMALLGTADVLALNVFDFPIPSATEIIASMMPIAIMMAMSYAQMSRAHVSVDLFKKHFSQRILNAIEILSLLVGLSVFLLMAYGAWQLAFNSYDVDERAVAAVRFPIWPIKIIFSFGITVCGLQMLFELLSKLVGGGKSDPKVTRGSDEAN